MTQQNSPFPPQKPDPRTRGNATIYVLIVVALFAALGFVVSRQNDTSESGSLSGEKADIVAGQILSYPAQVKQAVDMLTMSGVDPSDLNFTKPDQADFNTAPTITKIFHPDGAGLSLAALPEKAVTQTTSTPPPGWYLGMFNNIEWTKTEDKDVVLVAFQLSENICKRINVKLTGSDIIPNIDGTIERNLINKEYPPGNVVHGVSNTDFETDDCSICIGKPALCVRDTSGRFAYYSIIVNR